MNPNKDSKILDFVRVYKNCITKAESDLILTKAKDYTTWKTHEWSNYTTVVTHPDADSSKEFERSFFLDMTSRLMLNDKVNKVLDLYYHEADMYSHRNGLSNISLNHYGKGTEMKYHIDHIYSIFDGNIRGIPVVTILGLLHSDFKGGEFVICNDHVLPFEPGDIVVFPSLFMYPHEVKPVLEGDRYSFVAWAY